VGTHEDHEASLLLLIGNENAVETNGFQMVSEEKASMDAFAKGPSNISEEN